jgi:hypothetical protein
VSSYTPRASRAPQTIDTAFAFLRQQNTGLTPSGQSFGEVMPHFVLGGDETCLLASDGDVKIIGDKKKPKHDLPSGSSRTSATLYRTGSAAGAHGPTAFLPPGEPQPHPRGASLSARAVLQTDIARSRAAVTLLMLGVARICE